MQHPTPRTLFFAGTDTEVGKTYAASLVANSLVRRDRSVGVYKPVASGCELIDGQLVAEDAVALWRGAGCPLTLDEVCPQKFVAPLAPPEAAAAEGRTVDSARLRTGAQPWEHGLDVLIVEGAGGLFSPLAADMLNIDLAQQFADAQVVLVAANRLGVVHQVIATCTAAKHRGLTIRGVILCQPNPAADSSIAGNPDQIRRHCDVPILASIEHGATSIDTSWLNH